MNFYERFFWNLVKAHRVEILKKEKKEEEKLRAEIVKETKVEGIAKGIEEFKPEEVGEVKEEVKIEKIAAKELQPIFLREEEEEIPKPGEKERMLKSMKEFKLIKPRLPIQLLPPSQPPQPLPSSILSLIEQVKKEQEKKVEEGKAKEISFDFGSLNLIYNEDIVTVQCIENENIVVTYRDENVKIIDTKVTRGEIMNILNEIAEKTKIPLEKEYQVYFEDFFVQAWINTKAKLVIKKIM